MSSEIVTVIVPRSVLFVSIPAPLTLKYVTLSKTPEVGTKIKLKIMGYEPHTYYSAGAASLNTQIGGQIDQ